jgi:hypothetical protein
MEHRHHPLGRPGLTGRLRPGSEGDVPDLVIWSAAQNRCRLAGFLFLGGGRLGQSFPPTRPPAEEAALSTRPLSFEKPALRFTSIVHDRASPWRAGCSQV